MSKNKIAIVTGATGGFGKEFVKLLLNEELDEIWCVGRNKQKLQELEQKYETKIKTFSLDLSQIKNIKSFEKVLIKEKPLLSF